VTSTAPGACWGDEAVKVGEDSESEVNPWSETQS
jgi:hypothetical protein